MDKILLGIIGGTVIAVGILLSVSGFQVEDTTPITNVNTVPEHELLAQEKLVNWQSSGPFHINKKSYKIGESIFMRVESLEPHDKGQISILRQSNATHYVVWNTIPFDGSLKQFFNQYWHINLSVIKNICSQEDISGKWVLVFQGTEYPNLEFEFTDKILKGEENRFTNPVC